LNFNPDTILYEDNHLIVVNKSPSQIVQGDKTGDEPMSGIVIFARTSRALTRMNEMLKKKEIRKTYWAIVKNLPSENSGHLLQYIYRDQDRNKSIIVPQSRKGSQSAELTYSLLMSSDRYHLLEIGLLTGRHHQIRAQLAHLGCPIKGDLKYGFPRSNPDGSISLHARKVEFIHPVKKIPMIIEAEPPEDKLWYFFLNHS
jgi:23S rRNA pseudouridine1911/1915/1917 synthase